MESKRMKEGRSRGVPLLTCPSPGALASSHWSGRLRFPLPRDPGPWTLGPVSPPPFSSQGCCHLPLLCQLSHPLRIPSPYIKPPSLPLPPHIKYLEQFLFSWLVPDGHTFPKTLFGQKQPRRGPGEPPRLVDSLNAGFEKKESKRVLCVYNKMGQGSAHFPWKEPERNVLDFVGHVSPGSAVFFFIFN